MSIITSQQLTRYYEQHKGTEVTFNRQVIEATGLIPGNVFLKVSDAQWPCIVYSSSLASARVIAGVRSSFFENLRQSNNHAALRYSFKLPDKTDPIAFFVLCKVTGFTQYNPKNPDVQLITAEFTQRPPDDLIQVLGALLEANANAQRRRDERIILTPDSIKKLGLESKETFLHVEGVPRKCIVRDLSFGGARVLVPGLAKFLLNKKIALKIARGDSSDEISIPGEILRVEAVEGRRDIVVLGIQFTGELPMAYKLLINAYLTGLRKSSDQTTRAAAAAPAPAAPTRQQAEEPLPPPAPEPESPEEKP
jgi:hypothetical protein